MAFAVTGAFKAIEHKADIVGIIILATITGVAGGTIRDVILGKSLPNSLIDPSYVIITVVSAVVIFLLHSKMKKHCQLCTFFFGSSWVDLARQIECSTTLKNRL